jgi:4a-hydroxytetrahydrobiopterin dehydratase
MTAWIHTNNEMQKTYSFPNFEAAMQFMQRATPLITALDHHPEWTNIYNKVKVTLTTHDAGHIVTEKDQELSNLLDEVYTHVINYKL